jgi:hypothetical protein
MPVILATQEDQGSKPARANSSQDPILKKGLVEWLKALSPSPSMAKKKKKKKKKNKQHTQGDKKLKI